jgi:hypothetical protein
MYTAHFLYCEQYNLLFCVGYIILYFRFKLDMHIPGYILYLHDLCRIFLLFLVVVLILLLKTGSGTHESQKSTFSNRKRAAYIFFF